MRSRAICTWLLLCVMTCGAVSGCRSTPSMQHYQMSLETQQDKLGEGRDTTRSALITLGVDDFTSDSAYDDVRLIYRKSPYRLDYYHYHRWSSPPSMMITNLMRVGFERTGAFKAVTTGYGRGVDAVLRGRVVAIEEVDESDEAWTARISLDLWLEDGRSGEVIWSSVVTRTRDVETLNPEGVAIALSQVLGDLVVELAPMLTASYTNASAPTQATGNSAF
jgi:ABC-type uncharacterized transport system auxiliary subunit